MTDTLQQRLDDAIDKIQADSGILHEVVHGDATETVTTEGGEVDTVARALAQIANAGASGGGSGVADSTFGNKLELTNVNEITGINQIKQILTASNTLEISCSVANGTAYANDYHAGKILFLRNGSLGHSLAFRNKEIGFFTVTGASEEGIGDQLDPDYVKITITGQSRNMQFGEIIDTGSVIDTNVVAQSVYLQGLTLNPLLEYITDRMLPDDIITNRMIANNAVASQNIISRTITEAKIALATITGNNIAPATISGSNIASSTITGSHLANFSISNSKISNSTITNGKLANLTIQAEKIASNAITSAKIASNAIIESKIVDLAVTSAKIALNAITTNKIANLAVTGAKIANATITADKFAEGAIAQQGVADNAVTTPKILDLAVTTPKIANVAVTGAKIANGVIHGNHLGSEINGNLLVNGSFQFWTMHDKYNTDATQKNIVPRSVAFLGDYFCPRWSYEGNMQSKTTLNAISFNDSNALIGGTVPAGYSYAMNLHVASGVPNPGNSFSGIRYRFTGDEIARLHWGGASAVATTLSFWVRGRAGTYNIRFRNNTHNRDFVSQYVIASHGVWQQIVINIPGDTLAQTSYVNGLGNAAELTFFVAVGSSYISSDAVIDAWKPLANQFTTGQSNGTYDVTGRNFSITGIRLHPGISQVHLYQDDPAIEKFLVEKRYQKNVFENNHLIAEGHSFVVLNINQADCYYQFTEMERVPTSSISGEYHGISTNSSGGIEIIALPNPSIAQINTNSSRFRFAPISGSNFSAGKSFFMLSSSITSPATIQLFAELGESV